MYVCIRKNSDLGILKFYCVYLCSDFIHNENCLQLFSIRIDEIDLFSVVEHIQNIHAIKTGKF